MRQNYTGNLFYLFLIAAIITSTNVIAQTTKCVFCRIANGEIKSQVFYRDNSIVAFMDYAPKNPGHVLVIPRLHATEFEQMPDSTTRNMISIARKIVVAIKKTDIKAEGFNLQMNSGEPAGQEVPHAHLHIVPRYIGEQLNVNKEKRSPAELEKIAEKIREAMSR